MIYGNDEEDVLWSQLLEDSEMAFTRIYDIYFPILFHYCIRFTPDRSLIKDVLQDFFIGLFSGRKSPFAVRGNPLAVRSHPLAAPNDPLAAPGNPLAVRNLKSYLMVSVRRELFRRLGKVSRTPVESMTGQEYDFCLELSPESELINRQSGEHRSKHLQDIINALTARQREAVYLYFYENISYEEMAEIMGLKEVKYARTLIYRAISELRLILKKNDFLLGQIIS
jgi:RNA polymerase sigma factor (sigma-70 family)